LRLLCNSIYLAQQTIFKEFNEENIKKTKFIRNKSNVNLGFTNSIDDLRKSNSKFSPTPHSIEEKTSMKSIDSKTKLDEFISIVGDETSYVIDMTKFTKDQISSLYDEMDYDTTIFEYITNCDNTGEEEVDVILSFDSSCFTDQEELDYLKMIGLSITSQYPNNINIGGFVYGEKMKNISSITHNKLMFENRLLTIEQYDNRHSADGDTLFRTLNHCKTILDAQYKLSNRQHLWLFISECSNDNYYQIQTKKLCETLRSHKYNSKIICFYLRKSPDDETFTNFLKSFADLLVIFKDIESMYNYITPPATGSGEMLNPKLYYQYSILFIYIYIMKDKKKQNKTKKLTFFFFFYLNNLLASLKLLKNQLECIYY